MSEHCGCRQLLAMVFGQDHVPPCPGIEREDVAGWLRRRADKEWANKHDISRDDRVRCRAYREAADAYEREFGKRGETGYDNRPSACGACGRSDEPLTMRCIDCYEAGIELAARKRGEPESQNAGSDQPLSDGARGAVAYDASIPPQPTRAETLREAAGAVCDMCAGTTEWETTRNAKGYHVIIKTGSHPVFCSASAIHALIEKEGE